MKKRVVVAAMAMAFVMSGCSLSEYSEGLDEANGLVSDVVDAMSGIASEASSVAQEASPTAASIASEIKTGLNEVAGSDAANEIKENVREGAKEAGKKAAGAVSDSVKDAASKALSDTASKAVSDRASEALSSIEDSKTGGILTSAADIELENTDGKGKNYSFKYGDEEITAIYTTDNWKIKDSYRVMSESDMLIICQALIDEHPVHGRDMESFRTAEDMAYEWQIHNMAYMFYSDDNDLKKHAKDVDFDPKDQGLTLEEFYKSRTGKDLDINDILGGN